MQIDAGYTDHFKVSYDSSLSAAGPEIASAVLASCEADYFTIGEYFSDITPPDLPFRVLIENFPPGAYHPISHPGELHLGVDLGPPVNPRMTQFLNIAEFVETFALGLNRGWDPGDSTGEALSRVLATELYADQLDGFATAQDWIAAGRPDFVTKTAHTDHDFVATGCGALYLNFLAYYMNHDWQEIIFAGGPTLAWTYAQLTGRTDAWTRFLAALAAYPDPIAGSDNPFPDFLLRMRDLSKMVAAGVI